MNPTVRWPDKTLPVAIDCAPGVLTGLEMIATDGLLALPRTGMGIGGLLLGRRGPGGVTILRSLPIPCSHALGPSFVLTKEEIAATLEIAAPEDADDEIVVGWYCSKTREPLALTEHDHLLFDAFCPESWQVMLLIRPVRGKVTSAAFGLHDVDSPGTLQQGEWMDLAWQELAEYQAASPTVEVPPIKEAPPLVAVPDSTCRTLFGVTPPEPELSEKEWPSPWPRRLGIAAVLLAILAVAAFFTRDFWMPRPAVSLMASSDWSGRVSILWNNEALGNEDQASLVIEDGKGPLHTTHLNQSVIRAGWSEYECRAGKVTVTLLAGTLSDSVTLTATAKSYLPESGISK